MPVLRPVARWLVLPTIVGLPSSPISTVNVEVLLWRLSPHFVCSMLRLGCWAWSLHACAWSTSTSSSTLSMTPVLLYKVDSLLHGRRALAPCSPITLSWPHMLLHDIVWACYRVIWAISTIVLLLSNVVQVRITIQVGVTRCLLDFACSKFFEISNAWFESLNTLFLTNISISLCLSLLMDVHGIIPTNPLGLLLMIWRGIALILTVATTAITSTIGISLHFVY